jgi:hypothetical protein
MTYEVHNNRLLAMRMRDSRRWTLSYRDRAWKVAVNEARRRSFLSTIIFAVMHTHWLGRHDD